MPHATILPAKHGFSVPVSAIPTAMPFPMPFVRQSIEFRNLLRGEDLSPLDFHLSHFFHELHAQTINFFLLGQNHGIGRIGIGEEFSHFHSLDGQVIPQIPVSL